jgi:hypothetical protein
MAGKLFLTYSSHTIGSPVRDRIAHYERFPDDHLRRLQACPTKGKEE